MMDWNVIYKELTSKNNYFKPNPPATQKQISDVEKSLGCKLPNDLKELLLEMNGDNWSALTFGLILYYNQALAAVMLLLYLRHNERFYSQVDIMIHLSISAA